MGTRCTIRFMAGTDVFTVYQQLDGYPDNMIPKLQKFLKWNKSRNYDARYTVVNFIFWAKMMDALDDDLIKISLTKIKKAFNNGDFLTGYHMTRNGDDHENYFYLVNLEESTIAVDGEIFGFEENYDIRYND